MGRAAKARKKIRPAIGIISRDLVVLETATAVATACMALQKEYDFDYKHLIWGKGRTEGARNEVCENALRKNRTHLLFIDADCSFTPDMIPAIFRWPDLPIVGANAKNGLGKPVFEADINIKPINYITHDPIEMDSIGMHLTLIRLDILETIPKPWFYAPPKADGSNEIISEDVAFCRKARRYGFKTYMHPETSLRNLHWKRTALSMRDVIEEQVARTKQLLGARNGHTSKAN